MTQRSFAQTGLLHRRLPGQTATRFQVLGERSSGTNYVKRLMGRNLPLKATEALGWKHGPPQALAVPNDLIVVLAVRNAVDWALSMHAKPWHCTPEMQAMTFSDFIRAPFRTVVDHDKYFPKASKMGLIGVPLQPDRDPLTGGVHRNLFALRRAKLAQMLSYRRRDCHFVMLRMELAVAEPARVITALRREFALGGTDTPLRPVHKRLGARFNPAVEDRPPTPKQISAADLAYLKTQLDPALEAALGYSY